MSAQERIQENLANQRKVAVTFWEGYPNPALTEIRFTHDGDSPALGAGWSVNTVVTVGGREYNEILTKGSWGGDPLPDAPDEAAPGPTSVIYSDGSSETLR